MSRTIDERVVEMRFDNKQFQAATAATMSTLDKLKASLRFDGASKGLEDLSVASKKIDMGGLGNAIDTVKMKFSALEVIGVAALANITNSVVNTGKKMVSALTIDPVKTGFQEYETQINAVQTILANTQSKGTTLTEVSKALDELNTYADQTIYNFTEMTRNIGTFTAAGVDLDKSVTSIKGIANLAAISGSSAEQASSAMYQLSQALAAGKVSLMDWNSVVNAGMGGEVFQNALKRTANQMGYNVDALIEKYGSFRESLTEGQWLTAEVLTETLTQLSGAYTEADLIAQGYSKEQAKAITELAETAISAATDVKTFTQLWSTLKEAAQSGWTQTWEILVGDFEEAKGLLGELYTTFSEIIGKSAEARNELLYDTMTSNWKKITDGIADAGLSADIFKEKVTEIAKSKGMNIDDIVADYGSLEAAFKNGAISSDLLNEALLKMTGSSEEIQKKLTELQGDYKKNDDILKALNKAGYENADIQDLITKNTNGQTIALNDLSDAQLMSIGYTAEQVKEIRKLSQYSELANGSLKSFMDNVAAPQGRELLIDTLSISIRSLISIFERVGTAWRDVFPPTTSNQLLELIQSIRDFTLELQPTEETLDKIQRTFRGLFSILGIGKQALTAILSPITTLIGRFTDLSGGFLDITASVGDWAFELNKAIETSGSFYIVGDSISDVLNTIIDSFQYAIDKISGFDDVFSIDGSIITSSLNFIKEAISDTFDWIRNNVTAGDIFAGLAGGGIFIFFKKVSGLVEKVKELFSSFGDGIDVSGFSEILGSVHDSLESFQNGIQVASLVGIALSVTLLSSSLRKISEIEPVKIAYSLLAIRLMIASLTSGFRSLSKTLTKFNPSGVIKASISLIAISTAINILTTAMKNLSNIPLDDIIKGIGGIGGAIFILSSSLKIIGNNNVTLRTSIAILSLAQACKMLTESLQKFGSMSWDEIGRGLTAMGGALLELSSVMLILSKVGGGNTILGAAAILIAVQSLDEISENLKRLGALSWSEIGRGLTAMGGALLEFTIILSILGKVGGFGSLLGGAAILIAVQSLDEISENLKRLGALSWSEIGRGLTAMGGALTELAVITGLLGKLAGLSGLIGAGTILMVVQGLDEIVNAFQKFGSMSWDEIGRGLTAMGGALTEVAVISGLLGKLAGLSGLIGAGTILLAVQSLGDLADAMAKFSTMSWSEIGRGLVGMGGALTEVAVISGLTGSLAGFAGLVGAGTITLASQGLEQLANAFQKFGSMSWDEIGRGLTAMGAAMGETALGGLLNTFSGFGAAAISEMAEPLGLLADSIRKWQDVTVPENLGSQLHSLSIGVQAFNFAGWGADAIAAIAAPIGVMAESISKWSGVSIPDGLGSQLSSLSDGITSFNFAGWGADAITTVAPALGTMADSMAKWTNIYIPKEIGGDLKNLADGVSAFSFAFIGGWSISSLTEPLGNLANTIKLWNGIKIPEGIGDDLKDLADGIGAFGLSFVGGWTIGSIVGPLGDLAESVKKWSNVSLSGIGSNLDDLANGLNALGNVGVIKLASQFEESSTRIGNAAKIMFANITSSINSNKTEILNSFISLMNNIIQTVENKNEDFNNAGLKLVNSFTTGLLDTKEDPSSKFSLILANLLNTIRSKYSEFKSAGVYLASGFAKGIESNDVAIKAAQKLASNTIKAMQRKLEIHSPSKVARDEVGRYVVKGVAEGITDDMSAEEAASKKAQNITSAFQEELNKLDLEDTTAKLESQLTGGSLDYAAKYERQLKRVQLALGEYENMIKHVGKTAKETREAYNKYLQEQINLQEVQNEIQEEQNKTLEDSFNHSLEWIEKRKNASELNMIEELAAWKRVQSRYLEGTEQRIQADKEVLRLQEELASSMEDYYNELKTIQEDAENKRTEIDQEYEDERTRIKEEANEERLRLDEEYAEKTKEINDQLLADIEEAEKAYEDAIKSRSDTIYNSYGLFDEVSKGEEVTGDTLMGNLQGQIEALEEWRNNINSLANRGLDEGLLEELRKMGPSSASQIAALNMMTDEELNKYVDLWRTKHELATDQAEFELQGMREETNNTIEQLKMDAEIKLEEYRDTWEEQIDELNDNTEKQLSDLRKKWSKQIDDLNDETATKLENVKNTWMENVLGISTETQLEFVKMTNNLVDTVGNNTKWNAAGIATISGMLQGIVAKTPDLVEGVEDAMRKCLEAANGVLDINSPSKEFAKIGRYSDEGFAMGLKKYASLVSDSGENVGNTVLDTLRNAFSKALDFITNNINTQPTIRPVLDLTNINAETKKLNTMFSRTKALNISAAIQQRANNNGDENQNGTSNNNTGKVISFTQNNYSPKALSRIDIYRQTKNQFSALERVVKT